MSRAVCSITKTIKTTLSVTEKR